MISKISSVIMYYTRMHSKEKCFPLGGLTAVSHKAVNIVDQAGQLKNQEARYGVIDLQESSRTVKDQKSS